MHGFLIPLIKGLAAVFVISGVGGLVLRAMGIRNLGWYWNLAAAMLAGQAAASMLVETMLLCGAGSQSALRFTVGILAGLAIAGHVTHSWHGLGKQIGAFFRGGKIAGVVLLLALATNLVVSLAPSTKIDELYYHMLTPKRIVEDGGLRFYLLPVESAITPQMHYQIALSMAYVFDAPDVGNFLSWAYSGVLALFIMGFLFDATKSRQLSILCGALCGVGIYRTVWHTTGGAHALGDLAIVFVVASLLRPSALTEILGSYRAMLLLSVVSALAATTKLSLVPLSLVVNTLILVQVLPMDAATNRAKLIGAALLPWIFLHLPMMIWTYTASGSFWGPVLANMVRPSAFPEQILNLIRDLQAFNSSDIIPMARYAIIGFSPVFFASIAWVSWTAIRGSRDSRLVAGLLVFQGALVAWKFHFDFRFLGGLEYAAVVAAALSVAVSEHASRASGQQPTAGERLASWRNWILVLAGVPWLGLQIYYARPFAEVVSGLVSRERFLERYVALTADFSVLDNILPRDAVLYAADGRLPNFYAPRSVVLTPLDLHGRAPIYRLTIFPEIDLVEIDSSTSLKCEAAIYENSHAVIETYRTPGQAPMIGSVKVQRCQLISSRSQP